MSAYASSTNAQTLHNVLAEIPLQSAAIAAVPRLGWIVVWLAMVLCVLGCRTAPTQITVALDTDAPTDRRLSLSIHFLRAWDGGALLSDPALTISHGAGASDELPATFALIPPENGPRNQRAVVVVDAFLEGGSGTEPAVQWRRVAWVSFVQARTLRMNLFLSVRCAEQSTGCTSVSAEQCTLGTRCEEQGLTCGDLGECAPVEVVGTEEADVFLRPPPVDSSARDVPDLDQPSVDVPRVLDVATDVPQGPAPPGSQSFAGPTSTSFRVPMGVRSLTIALWGAGGGRATGSTDLGAAGGFAGGTLTVTEGEVLNIVAGGRGGDAPNIAGTGGAGGAPGGGGNGGASTNNLRRNGGGGGGRSEVSRGGVVLLVAGGGGGRGHGADPMSRRLGGVGGGTSGQAGANGALEGGGGGSSTAGGRASSSCPAPGAAGIRGGGGRGGSGPDNGGGGGGGGLWGGGGGCGANNGPGGGGGGGSGFVGPGVNGSTVAGNGSIPGNSGDPDRAGAGSPGASGRVVIRW